MIEIVPIIEGDIFWIYKTCCKSKELPLDQWAHEKMLNVICHEENVPQTAGRYHFTLTSMTVIKKKDVQ